METKETKVLLLTLALLYQRAIYIEKLKAFRNRTLQIGESDAMFLVELILCGNFDEEILETIFCLPVHIIEEIRKEFLT